MEFTIPITFDEFQKVRENLEKKPKEVLPYKVMVNGKQQLVHLRQIQYNPSEGSMKCITY
jgi:hypothetical protein